MRATMRWKDHDLDTNINNFGKTLCEAKWTSKWITQNRNQNIVNNIKETEIDWQTTWENQHPSRITNPHTNREEHDIRRFSYKLLNEELPTKKQLYKRQPEIYKTDHCHKCNETEDTTHIFATHHSKRIYQKYIKVAREQITARTTGKHNKKINEILEEIIEENTLNIDRIVKGIVTKKMTEIIKIRTQDKWKETIIAIRKEMVRELQKIWRERCDENSKWEENQGITKKMKRNRNKNRIKKLGMGKNTNNEGKRKFIKDSLIARVIEDGLQITRNNFFYILSAFYNTNGALAR
jgi:hypothetical protein